MDTSAKAGSMIGTLASRHRAMLEKESGIAPELIEARGYRTVETQAELERRGFGRQQRNVPGLLLPIFGPSGEQILYQYRPDEPRIKGGKPVKYETPAGSRMVLDVPPAYREKIRDPNTPLFITEGIKKGDSLASRELATVALIGVWNWRGTNEAGGKTALPEWECIALNGRRVYVVFDSDVMEKREVYAALSRLKGFLESRDARVALIYLPAGEGGKKQGVDDYLTADHTTDDLLALATHELREPPQEESGERSCPYRETSGGGLVWEKPTHNGPVPTPLTNFTARIVRDVAEDDGAEVRRHFEIEASLNERREFFSVPSSQFVGMGWATEHLGAGAIVYPGFGAKDHARAAVQMLSGEVPIERVYAHTGWREVDGEWVYLHAGGAIGQVGQVGHIRTELAGSLGERVLPDPPEGEELVRAIRSSLGVLTVGPDRLTFPVLAAVYRALLADTDFGVHFSGPTGEGKSELVALCQQHNGAGLDARNLTSWESTENAIEGQAFQAKDQVMALDDFAPTGSSYDVQRWHKKADRVFRSKGNASSRQRMRVDTTLRPDKPPRALIISTGEDVPRGQSLRARLLVLELAPGELRWDKLSARQRDAADGLYAGAVSGYVRWLAARYDEVRARLGRERVALREAAATTAQHRRTPGIVADLALGLRYFLTFAYEVGVLTAEQSEKLWSRGWWALGEAAAEQQGHQAAGEPTGRFRELLSAAVASGRAHVAGPDGEQPRNPGAWGWRKQTVGSGDFEREEWKPQGERVGWVEDEDLYLEPDAAYAVVQKQGRDSGDSLSLSERTLRKRLHERGLLLSVEDNRPTLAVRRTLGGRRRRVLHLSGDFLSPHMAQPDQPDHDYQEPLGYGKSAPPLWSGDGSGPDHKPDHKPDQESSPESNGQVAGQVGNVTDHETDQGNPLTYEENSGVGQVGQVSDGSRDQKSNGGVRTRRTGGEDKQRFCIHDLSPDACKVCNGLVRRLVEEGMSEKFARAEVLGEKLVP